MQWVLLSACDPSAELEHDSRPGAQVYDSLEQRWHAAQAVGGKWHHHTHIAPRGLRFCESERLCAATVLAEDSSDMQHGRLPDTTVLVIFGVQTASVTRVPATGMFAVRWLPGTTLLLVLGKRGVARLDLDPAALTASAELHWTRLPELPQLGCTQGAGLDPVPGTDRALLLVGQAAHGRQPARAHLVLINSSSLATLGTWCKTVESPLDSHSSTWASLHCSWSAVAVCVGYAGFQVHQLDQGRVGTLIFVHRSPPGGPLLVMLRQVLGRLCGFRCPLPGQQWWADSAGR